METAAGEGANTEAGEEGRRIKDLANLLTDPQQAEVGGGGKQRATNKRREKNPLPPLERLGNQARPRSGMREPCWLMETGSAAVFIPVKTLAFPHFLI